jgi:hypothetical protein
MARLFDCFPGARHLAFFDGYTCQDAMLAQGPNGFGDS